MAGAQTLERIEGAATAPSAAVWINGRQANVATIGVDGHVRTCEISRGWLSEQSYLAQVIRAIGDRERVAILGPTSERLALERDYVAIYHRPDRLIDVEPAGPTSSDELIERLRTLAG
jgi:hypothetical protein